MGDSVEVEYVAVWPDGVWCWEDEVEEMLQPPCAKSDDYKLVEFNEEVHA